MSTISILASLLLLAAPASARPQDPPPAAGSFDAAAAAVKQQLSDSLAELAKLRETMAAEKIPLSRQLSDLESELSQVRAEYQQTTRLLESRTLDLSNLRDEIKKRQDAASYLSNLLSEYLREFEARLHIAELPRYRAPLEAAKLASDNGNLTAQQVYQAQAEMIAISLERLHDAIGGTRFAGTAVDANGRVQEGIYAMVGPAALFRSVDGQVVGTAEQRIGSLETATIPFADPLDAAAAEAFVASGGGSFVIDPTLGMASKIVATKESVWEHIQSGGPVMVPILGMAGLALLVALYKWLTLAFVPQPSKRSIDALLEAVGRRDQTAARQLASAIRGPVGRMLAVGVEHLNQPRELIEEVMYETVLTTRLRLQRLLPFIAICAASAPLLGLLGTVTGMINTFDMITVYGSGDAKSLSGGISEALITTEYGLIVAIPALLLHAFLSRKASGVVGQMEGAAVALVNQVSKTPQTSSGSGTPDAALVKEQVKEILRDLLDPMLGEDLPEERAKAHA
jgi:biopolymer transport protein ExbB